jgi:hypothetical protein
MRAPTNLAIQLERARLAAKLRDGQRLRESVDAIGRDSAAVAMSRRRNNSRSCRKPRPTATSTTPRCDDDPAERAGPVPAFSESLMAVRTPAELIAEPSIASWCSRPPVDAVSAGHLADVYAERLERRRPQMAARDGIPLNVRGLLRS